MLRPFLNACDILYMKNQERERQKSEIGKGPYIYIYIYIYTVKALLNFYNNTLYNTFVISLWHAIEYWSTSKVVQ